MLKHKVFAYPESTFFKDTQDPSDNAFRLLTIRIPHDPTNTPYGPYEYHGVACRDRLVRFCATYLAGFGYLTPKEAEKICNKHPRPS